MADVTDATFEAAVIERSHEVPVVVDLWAEWCGPCKTLGPILEKVIGETGGKVELAKIDVDANPAVSRAFQVQSIPAVVAFKDGKPVDSFLGAQPEHVVRAFVDKLAPPPSPADQLVSLGDEDSLRRALELEPDHPGAIVALAEILVGRDEPDEALTLLARIPETAEVRRVAALARVASTGASSDGDIESTLTALLDRVRDDDAARQQYVDLLEVLGPDDPRTGSYRKALTSRLF